MREYWKICQVLKEALQNTLDNLRTLPKGHAGSKEFEEIVGSIIKLCFFRSLTNVQSRERDLEGTTIRDWVASNRAPEGFWEVIRNKYGSTQIVWECKNYDVLKSDDFHQINYYLNDTFGRFGIIAFRGEDMRANYYRHISNIINRNRSGMVVVLTQKDLEVFLRQAIKGAFKESHLQDKYDQTIRQIS